MKPRLPSAFSLFNPSLQALKFNIGPLSLIACLPLIPILIACGILLWGVLASGEAISGLAEGSGSLGPLVPYLIETIPFVVIGVVAFIVIGPVIAYIFLRSAQGIKLTSKQALREGLAFFWRWLGLHLLIWLVYAALFLLPLFLVIAWYGMTNRIDNLNDLGPLLTLLGILLLLYLPLFIVYLWLSQRFMMAQYYLLDKNMGVMAALRKSWQTGKQFSGAVWGVVGVQLLIDYGPSLVPYIGSLVSLVLEVLYACAPAVRYVQIQQALGGTAAPQTPAAAKAPLPPQATAQTIRPL